MDNNNPPVNLLNFENAADGLKAIAHEGRLQILCVLVGNELTVGEIVERVKISQSAVSQHLARMKSAGVLESRRSGNQVYYSVKERGFEDLVTTICKIYVE